MKLADRMNNIGVESAFDVLMRARALEAKGRNIVHTGDRRARFPRPPRNIVEAAKKALDEGWTHYGPTLVCPNSARRLRRTFRAPAASTWGRSMWARRPRR